MALDINLGYLSNYIVPINIGISGPNSNGHYYYTMAGILNTIDKDYIQSQLDTVDSIPILPYDNNYFVMYTERENDVIHTLVSTHLLEKTTSSATYKFTLFFNLATILYGCRFDCFNYDKYDNLPYTKIPITFQNDVFVHYINTFEGDPPKEGAQVYKALKDGFFDEFYTWRYTNLSEYSALTWCYYAAYGKFYPTNITNVTQLKDYIKNKFKLLFTDYIKYSMHMKNYETGDIAAYIRYIKPSDTKVYINSTWSSSKTWYIKVSFSTNSMSHNGGSNVVNYVTSHVNLFLKTYHIYEATYRVAGFIFLNLLDLSDKNRGSITLPLSILYVSILKVTLSY